MAHAGESPIDGRQHIQRQEKLRRLAKEIDAELMSANLRKSFFCLNLLGQVLALYQVDGNVAREVKKIRGKQLDELRQDLFALFAQVGTEHV